ncbi:DUF2249 domain-containing protein [Halolamina sp. CBA1230]|uniref:DUF2249 domain-containing protein n=1 Tax=Halolamina sp. CBA1230 TaxID=1853690 RepID=UPI0009A23629|nr:DUF2249 domain-containing protein [Halolamina sp. CBA1230]QKY19437.1 DUF2249 domain-containing protein [Halolamina sp. CBA1230]
MAADERPDLDDRFDDAPVGHEQVHLDARDLPPPKPLRETLERLAELDEETVLVQTNDRRPQHLYPRLEDRGYEYETVADGDAAITAIWPA